MLACGFAVRMTRHRKRTTQGPSIAIGDFIRNSQVWKSIFRHPAPRDRRNRVVVMLTNVFLHLHPVSVRKSGIALSYTWCMGGLTFFLFQIGRASCRERV